MGSPFLGAHSPHGSKAGERLLGAVECKRNMALKDLVAEAKQRMQRQWPTLLVVEQERTLSRTLPGRSPEELKRFQVLLGQDVDAGVQVAAVVAEHFGSVGEHVAIGRDRAALLATGSGVLIKSGSAFDPHNQWVSNELLVTGNVLHVYTDRLAVPLSDIQAAFELSGFHAVLRDEAYWRAHDEARPPDLFICHDTADKDGFVRPLVESLNRQLVKVWYDEQSLRPGESLVDGVERGLQAARYGILVLSPAFLANRRWAAREFRSLVTRDIAEERRILVPIWLGVDRDMVARYSLDLADRVAVVVREGTSPATVCDQLIRTMRLTVPDLRPPPE